MVAKPLFQGEAGNKPKVLVADDDLIMQAILRSLLEDAGYTVILAANGRETLKLAANFQISIAFIDLAMPEGDGLQICSGLRKIPTWSNVPIIVLTHYPLNQALKASLDAGANGFLCKPLIPSELLWCLEVHTKRQKSTIVKGSVPQNDVASQLTPSTEHPPPFQPSWILQAPQASVEGQLDAFKSSRVTESTYSDRSVFSSKEFCLNLVGDDCSRVIPSTITQDGKNAATQSISHQANSGSGRMHLATDMETLHYVTTLFAFGGLTKLLKLLTVLIEEILSGLRSGEAARSHVLSDRLHKLAGTAGTLGCGSLSVAARELEYNFSLTAEDHFIKVSNATLDVIRAYVAEESGSVSASSLIPKQRVLVVDDALMNRDIASAFLSAAGHIVTCVEGGADAVSAVAAADFDVVLMDVRMPGVDGLEATRRIRKLPGMRGCVPIVALTAQVFSEQTAECQRAGMDGHLAKPFDPKALLTAVARAIDANRRHRIEVHS